MSQSAFFQLSQRLQRGIAHTLGWSALRPVQEQTIEALLNELIETNLRILTVLAATQRGLEEYSWGNEAPPE